MLKQLYKLKKEFAVGFACELANNIFQTLSSRTIIIIMIGVLAFGSAKAVVRDIRNNIDQHKNEGPPEEPHFINYIGNNSTRLVRRAKRVWEKSENYVAATDLLVQAFGQGRIKGKWEGRAVDLLKVVYPLTVQKWTAEVQDCIANDSGEFEADMISVRLKTLMINVLRKQIRLHKRMVSLKFPAKLVAKDMVKTDLEALIMLLEVTEDELAIYKVKQSKLDYVAGSKILNEQPNIGVKRAQKAYSLLARCNQLQPNYQDVVQKMAVAKDLGTLVISVQTHVARNLRPSSSLAQGVYQGVENNLRKIVERDQFLKLVRGKSEAKNLILIHIQVTGLRHTKVNISKGEPFTVTKTIKDGDVDKEISAVVTKYTANKGVIMECDFQIVRMSDQHVILSGHDNSNWFDARYYAKFSGNRKAIKKSLMSQIITGENPLSWRSAQSMENAAASKLGQNVARSFLDINRDKLYTVIQEAIASPE